MTKLYEVETHLRTLVEEGLSASPKRLPGALFYDEVGDKLFQQITRLPEYYLTRCEYEILNFNKQAIEQAFFEDASSEFDVVELGAGDGLKTEVLLSHFTKSGVRFRYCPVDISASVLGTVTERFQKSLPDLRVLPLNADYYEALHQLKTDKDRKIIVLFLGSNIGNFTPGEASDFLKGLFEALKFGDKLFVGFDLKKDPRLIAAAYNDSTGITYDFNMNMLVRLNRELGADFQPDRFAHYPFYNPETGAAKSYLISLKEQSVYIRELNKQFNFKAGEYIYTEISQKYDKPMIERLAFDSGFQIRNYFYDCKEWFCDVLFVK